MWTLILIYAMRAWTTPDFYAPAEANRQAMESHVTAEPVQQPRNEMTIDEIAAAEPMVAGYMASKRDAEGTLANLETALGAEHPRVRETRSRVKIMQLRVDEFAAMYRQNFKAVRAYQNMEIRQSLDAIDRIDIELDQLSGKAGPSHPRARTLRHYRDQHQEKIQELLRGGAA